MAGGTFTSQNKVRPGVYIRFKSTAGLGLSVGERGVVTICKPMSWGPIAQVMEIEQGMDLIPLTGYDVTSSKNMFLREIFKGSNRTSGPSKVLLYRPAASGSAQAEATVSAGTVTTVTATAVHPGAAELQVVCAASGSAWEITVALNGEEVETQTVQALSEFTSQWVTITGELPLAPFDVTLSGGTDGSATAATATPLTNLTATSLLKGEVGNKLSVACIGERAPFTVVVTLDDVEVERQSVQTLADFSSDWLTLAGTGATLAAFEATALSGAVNGTATAASGALMTRTSSLVATAKYPGVRGNDISIIVTEQTDGDFLVSTVVDGEIADQQSALMVDELTDNDWVKFSGTGVLTATTGAPLTGGADGQVQAAAYSAYLSVIEPHKFDILIYDGNDNTVKSAMVGFINRIAEENGQYAQLVAAGLTNPDSRYVINVESGVTLSDGTVLTKQEAVWWVGGAEAGARYNESLTYASYPDAVAASPMRTNSEYIAALRAGNLVFFAEDGQVKVEQDINSLVTYTPEIGKAFCKNRVMRLCNTIANDIYQQFSASFIGVVNNNEVGRSLFKSTIVGYLLELEGQQAIQNFSADDVEVLQGEDIDAIVVNIAISVVDSVEKIYLTVEVS